MIDSILKYLSVITVAGAGISFAIGLVKYIDQRNREENTKRYELFRELIKQIAGTTGNPMTLQLASIYQLQAFKEYSFASIPILEFVRSQLVEDQNDRKDKRSEPISKAIDETLTALRK